MDKFEVRAFEGEPLEFRAATSGSGSIGTFSGYAMRYDQPSLPLPFIERFAPGSFTRSLKSKNDIRLFVNHNDTMVLASRRAKTLRIEDRPEGLWIEADLPDTSYGRDLRVLMERGDVHTQSVGFSAVRDAWNEDGSQRTVTEAKLFESSIVTGIAAYPQTTASVRNLRAVAQRAMVDADALAEAIANLEAGNQLDADQVQMLMDVVGSLAVEDPAVETPDAPDMGGMEDAEITIEGKIPMSIFQKQLDMLAKEIGLNL